jgi:multidrug efflux pump subunit AcrB
MIRWSRAMRSSASFGAGHAAKIAAWLGPTKLATAILFATITNIVAYLPYMLLPGDTGTFLYSLPVVIGCSLIASRLVSMTFIPLLGYYLLTPKLEPTVEQRRPIRLCSDVLPLWADGDSPPLGVSYGDERRRAGQRCVVRQPVEVAILPD